MRYWKVLAMLVAAVACTALGTSLFAVESAPTPAATALTLCRTAFGSDPRGPGGRAPVTSAPGTVFSVRTWNLGAGPPSDPDAFPGAATSAAARGHHYRLYAVTAGYKPLYVEDLYGTRLTTPGRHVSGY